LVKESSRGGVGDKGTEVPDSRSASTLDDCFLFRVFVPFGKGWVGEWVGGREGEWACLD